MSDSPIQFGPFSLDPLALELRCRGLAIPLEPLPARILLRLASECGTLVPRRELLELGWPRLPGAAEQSLNTCMHQIRQALSVGETHGVEIQTLRGRGYRLKAPAGASAGPPSWQGALPRGRRRTLGLAMAGLAAVAAAVLLTPAAAPPAGARDALDAARHLAEESNDLAGARALLDSALVRYPDQAALHAEWAELGFWLGDRDGARSGVQRALALNGGQPTGQRTRALLALLDGDWPTADAALQRALREDPQDTRTLTTLAYRRSVAGRFAEAEEYLSEALRIDPLSTAVHRDAGLIYLLVGRFPEAERYCQMTLRFQPRSRWAADCLFDVMVLTRRPEEAAEWGRRLLEWSEAPAPTDPRPAAVVAAVEVWRLERWTQAVEQGAHPYGLALAYAANGEAEQAIAALRRGLGQPDLGALAAGVDPRLAGLRSRPEFQAILGRLGLST